MRLRGERIDPRGDGFAMRVLGRGRHGPRPRAPTLTLPSGWASRTRAWRHAAFACWANVDQYRYVSTPVTVPRTTRRSKPPSAPPNDSLRRREIITRRKQRPVLVSFSRHCRPPGCVRRVLVCNGARGTPCREHPSNEALMAESRKRKGRGAFQARRVTLLVTSNRIHQAIVALWMASAYTQFAGI